MDEIGRTHIPHTLLHLECAEYSVWKLEPSNRIYLILLCTCISVIRIKVNRIGDIMLRASIEDIYV
jgi:hypothetical protein